MGKCDSYTRMLQMNPPLDHQRCLQGNRCFSPPASMRSRLASGSFKMASEAFIGETDKISNSLRQYCSDFLDLEILRSLLS